LSVSVEAKETETIQNDVASSGEESMLTSSSSESFSPQQNLRRQKIVLSLADVILIILLGLASGLTIFIVLFIFSLPSEEEIRHGTTE
jgi:hypothetical protein